MFINLLLDLHVDVLLNITPAVKLLTINYTLK